MRKVRAERRNEGANLRRYAALMPCQSTYNADYAPTRQYLNRLQNTSGTSKSLIHRRARTIDGWAWNIGAN